MGRHYINPTNVTNKMKLLICKTRTHIMKLKAMLS